MSAVAAASADDSDALLFYLHDPDFGVKLQTDMMHDYMVLIHAHMHNRKALEEWYDTI
jgi:hypothetical protein